MSNNLFAIHPYRYHDMWVFDDTSRGLDKEPLIAGIPEIIHHVKGDNVDEISVIFSDSHFPGATALLERLNPESGGYWYQLEGTEMIGWLCSVLFRFFDTAPQKIYMEIK